jgi:hypothetical protein
MKFIMLCVSALVLLSSEPSFAAQQRAGEEKAVKTGWILLGDLNKSGTRWGSAGDPSVDYFSGVFEILDRHVDRRSTALPKVGERIRVTVRSAVTIVDYRVRGEQRVRESPSSARRPLGPDDNTGLFVAQGAIVRVDDVRVSNAAGQLRAVWARVSDVN